MSLGTVLLRTNITYSFQNYLSASHLPLSYYEQVNLSPYDKQKHPQPRPCSMLGYCRWLGLQGNTIHGPKCVQEETMCQELLRLKQEKIVFNR